MQEPEHPDYPIRDGRPALDTDEVGSPMPLLGWQIAATHGLLEDLARTSRWIIGRGEVDPEIVQNHGGYLRLVLKQLAGLPDEDRLALAEHIMWLEEFLAHTDTCATVRRAAELVPAETRRDADQQRAVEHLAFMLYVERQQ